MNKRDKQVMWYLFRVLLTTIIAASDSSDKEEAGSFIENTVENNIKDWLEE